MSLEGISEWVLWLCKCLFTIRSSQALQDRYSRRHRGHNASSNVRLLLELRLRDSCQAAESAKPRTSHAAHRRQPISLPPTSKFHHNHIHILSTFDIRHSLLPTTPRRWPPPTSRPSSTPPRKMSRCSSPRNATSAARTCRCTWSPTCGRRGRTAST